MPGTDIPYINKTLGQVYTDLGYLVDVGVISDADYEQITAKIPRRHREGGATSVTTSMNNLALTQGGQAQNNPNRGRVVPAAPLPARDNTPAPPAYVGVGQAEAMYDYPGPDAGDLSFKLGDKITILEYVNSDWWKGESNGKEGLFPSNYVRKISDTGRPSEKSSALQPINHTSVGYQPSYYSSTASNVQVNQAQGVSAPLQQQPVTVVQDKKNGRMNSMGSKVGNAALFGAGATLGGKVVNAIF